MTTHSNYRSCLKALSVRYCRPQLGYNLKLNVFNSDIVKDPVTGEIMLAGTTQEEIRARVNQEKDPDTENTQGSDRDRIYVTGYLVEPLRIGYDLGDRLNGKYLYEGHWVDCSFYPVPLLADNLTEYWDLHSHTGRKIAGYLKLEGIA